MMYAIVPADFDPARESPRTLFFARETAEAAAAPDRAAGLGSRVVAYRISLRGPGAPTNDKLVAAVPDAPDLLPDRPRWGVTLNLDAPTGRVHVLGKIPAELLAPE